MFKEEHIYNLKELYIHAFLFGLYKGRNSEKGCIRIYTTNFLFISGRFFKPTGYTMSNLVIIVNSELKEWVSKRHSPNIRLGVQR
jgi:hypothetical protein